MNNAIKAQQISNILVFNGDFFFFVCAFWLGLIVWCFISIWNIKPIFIFIVRKCERIVHIRVLFVYAIDLIGNRVWVSVRMIGFVFFFIRFFFFSFFFTFFFDLISELWGDYYILYDCDCDVRAHNSFYFVFNFFLHFWLRYLSHFAFDRLTDNLYI